MALYHFSLNHIKRSKPVYEESRKIFFKAKQNEYREKHHAEISKFQKAKRILSEQGYDEPSFEICREMWTEACNDFRKGDF